MEDLSLHILDIAENSVRADARLIGITVTKDAGHDLLVIEVVDDGKGMDAGTLAKVRDPFFTTKHKKTGLGIPLLTQAAEQTGGDLAIESAPGMGTRVTAKFRWGHPDRPPVGNIAETLLTLIAGHPDRDYIYEERNGSLSFRFDSRELKSDLDNVPINEPEVLNAVRELLRGNISIL
ncbi:MAG TPA: ATP-binding protein [Nitrospirota bacterium]|nr:ATP-binding protein [Nitrospirota bacterium]